MKHRILLATGLLTLSFLLAGCGSSGPVRDINDPTNSLVFGYVDMDEAATSVDAAWMQQIAPPSETPYWSMGVKNGLFYQSRLPPGSYQMSNFYGSGFFAGENRYNFPRQGNETSMRISKPDIYFIGSFKYRKIKTSIFEQDKFAIEKINKPSEAELLKRILDENNDIRESAWGEKIRARLAQLKK